jgi:hypothetical protein
LIFGEFKLFYIDDSDCFLEFLFFMEVPGSGDQSLIKYLKLFASEFGLHFFQGSFLVGVVDVNKIRFYIVGDCWVMWGFVELSLAGVTVQRKS